MGMASKTNNMVAWFLLLLCLASTEDHGKAKEEPESFSSSASISPEMLQQFSALFPLLMGSMIPGLDPNNSRQLSGINDNVKLLTKSLRENPETLSIILSMLGSVFSGSSENVTEINSTNVYDGGNKSTTFPSANKNWNQCESDASLMLQGVSNRESWALHMLDASGKPGHSMLKGNFKFMGNYEECRDVTHLVGKSQIEGNICRIYIFLPFTIVPPVMGNFQPPIQWDVCLPKSCTDPYLSLAFDKYLSKLSIFPKCTKDLQMSGDSRAIIALTVLALFGVFIVVGTTLDIVKALKKSNDKYVVNGQPSPAFDHTQHRHFAGGDQEGNQKMVQLDNISASPSPDGLTHETIDDRDRLTKAAPLPRWQRALLAFSVPRNLEKILKVKSVPGSIGCLHGIRVLSLAWVIVGHFIFYVVLLGNFDNPLDVITKLSRSVSFQIITSAYLAVDTFFVLSGLLTCYLFLSKLGRKGRITVKEFILYYVHRYWRLTPPLMIWIMIVACLFKYLGEGRPAWEDYDVSGCKDNWWANILYINNLYKKDPECVGITWYLACDMQFYIIAPLALIPWVWGKKVIGFIVALALLCCHIFSTLGLEIKYDADNFKNSDDYNEYIYFKPYTRVGPYAIGLMLGWVLWKTKSKVKMNRFVVLSGWTICFGLILLLGLVTHDDLKDLPNTSWPKPARVIYQTFHRPLWAMAISWMIIACATGHGGYVNSILSWEGWLPMSRLSYCGYLVHMTIMFYEGQFPEYKLLMTMTSVAYTFIGYFVMTYAVAFLLTIVVESPALALEKVVLG